MGGTNEVLGAIDAAVDDLAVSRDAMRSGPAVEPDPGDLPLVSALLLASCGRIAPVYVDIDDPSGSHSLAIVSALIAALGPPA